MTAYIPTNVISITDGQIHLDTRRFERNERPAVDVGRSVSRIGGAAQPPAMRLVARNLRILHARFEQLEALARVGLEVDPAVEREIARGRLLRALLRQDQGSPRAVAEQVVGARRARRGLARPDGARLPPRRPSRGSSSGRASACPTSSRRSTPGRFRPASGGPPSASWRPVVTGAEAP